MICSGELDITIEGPSEADVHCLDNEDGTCTVSYFPTEPGDYEIQIQHDDVPIRGSPFKAKIAGKATPTNSNQYS